METILFCGIGPTMTNIIPLAKEMGLNVLVFTKYPGSPFLNLADAVKIFDVKDEEKALKAAMDLNKKYDIGGVTNIGTETTLAMARIREKLGTYGPNYDTIKRCTLKHLRIQRLKDKKVSCPDFRLVYSMADAEKGFKDLNQKVVLKPVDSSGARGVSLVLKKKDLPRALKLAKKFTRKKEHNFVLMEEFSEGTEHSTESIEVKGKFYNTGFSDRTFLKQFRPYFVELGDSLPTKLKNKQQNSVKQTANKAARALGLTNWVSKGDMVFTKKGPQVLELAARTSGYKFGTDIVPLNNGTNISKAHIQQVMGWKVDTNLLKPRFNKAVELQSLFAEKTGRITKIEQLQNISDMPGVYYFHISEETKKGTIIEPELSLASMLAHVITIGKNKKIAKERARNALDNFRVTIN